MNLSKKIYNSVLRIKLRLKAFIQNGELKPSEWETLHQLEKEIKNAN